MAQYFVPNKDRFGILNIFVEFIDTVLNFVSIVNHVRCDHLFVQVLYIKSKFVTTEAGYRVLKFPL